MLRFSASPSPSVCCTLHWPVPQFPHVRAQRQHPLPLPAPGVVELRTGQSLPLQSPSPWPGSVGAGCGRDSGAVVVQGWLNRAGRGMLHPWGRGQRGLSTRWGFAGKKIAGSGQVLLLLTEQHPRAGPSPGQGTFRIRPPRPQCGAGCQGSAGFHTGLQAGNCPAWPLWDPGLSKSC